MSVIYNWWLVICAGMALGLIAYFSLPAKDWRRQITVKRKERGRPVATVGIIGVSASPQLCFSSPSSETSACSLGAGFNKQRAGTSTLNTPDQSFFSCPSQIQVSREHSGPPTWLFNPADLEIIRRAAERNGCLGDNLYILFAIRRAENGSPGNEFGVKGVRGLDKQAGWAAASIIKSRRRWIAANRPTDFITFLGERFCPPGAHPLNKNWVKNVKYWFERIENENL